MGGGLRSGRRRVGDQRAGSCAALALALACFAVGAPAQSADPDPFDRLIELLEPEGNEEPQFAAMGDQFLAVWERDEAESICIGAWVVSQELRNFGRFESARELIDLVLGGYPESPYRPLLLVMRGDLERYLGRPDVAFSHFEEAERLGDPSGVLELHLGFYLNLFRGEALLELGLLRPSRDAFDRASEFAVPLKARHREVGSSMDVALVDLGLLQMSHNLDLALRLHGLADGRLREALGGAIANELPDQVGLLKLMRGQVLLNRARDVKAGLESGEVGPLLEEAESELLAAIQQAHSFELAFKGRVALVDVYFLAGKSAEEREVLREIEATPATLEAEWGGYVAAFKARRALRDRAERGELERALADLETEFDRIRAEWLAFDRPPEGVGFLQWDEQLLVLEVWVELLLALHGSTEGAERTLQPLASAHSIGTLTQRVGKQLDLEPGGLWKEFRRSLPEAAGVVIFLPGLDGSHVLALDRERVVHGRMPSRRELERASKAADRHVRRRPRDTTVSSVPDEGLAAARTLASMLFPDSIEARLMGWTSVTFIGADLCGDPSLEWLPLGEAEGALPEPRIGDRLATSYLPSMDLGAMLAARFDAEAYDPGELVVLAATGLPAPDDLFLTQDERRDLIRLAGEKRARFDEQARLGGALGQGLLAIVAHGRHLAAERRPAHLRLAHGLTGAADLEASSLPPVVCLLACGAARGPVLRGDDGAVHLGGAALLGGASSVLLARNDIDAGSSLALFGVFLEELREGRPPDEALRRARVELPERDSRWRHPYYSTSLRLFGLPRLPR